MSIILAAALTAIGLFGGVLLLLETGRRIGGSYSSMRVLYGLTL
jgi:hypothetical protein